jgi:hypothetical protein
MAGLWVMGCGWVEHQLQKIKKLPLWLDWACFLILMHPPWSQGVNFDALINVCACSAPNSPPAEKNSPHAIPNRLKSYSHKRF